MTVRFEDTYPGSKAFLELRPSAGKGQSLSGLNTWGAAAVTP